jgi:FkbM family methyltransferase
VALEPQPGPARVISLLHGRDPDVTLVRAAAGDRAGDVVLHVNSANPTVSTTSDGFIDAADGAGGWEGQVWDRAITVPCLTLDDLIRTHGRPAFIKIDVEGFEDRVLAGLSEPVPALSFEFTTIARDVARRCLGRLANLGPYRFDLALGETQTFFHDRWIEAQEMGRVLEASRTRRTRAMFMRRCAPRSAHHPRLPKCVFCSPPLSSLGSPCRPWPSKTLRSRSRTPASRCCAPRRTTSP